MRKVKDISVLIPTYNRAGILRETLESMCRSDRDGVLCRNPTAEENDDGKRYLAFVRGVEAQIILSRKVGWLVTCRLEKYRTPTEEWLTRHGMQYGDLIMMSYPTPEARRRAGAYGLYKARVYLETGADLFIESSPPLAVEIARRTGKYVWCAQNREMISPGALHHCLGRSRYVASSLWHDPRSVIRKILNRARARLPLAARDRVGSEELDRGRRE